MAPLGLVGVVPALLIFNQPFGFNAIPGLIGRAGILMRPDRADQGEPVGRPRRLSRRDQGDRPAHAAGDPDRACHRAGLHPAYAFRIQGSMAYTLIGGTAAGTVLFLLFLPALYVAWFRIKPAEAPGHTLATAYGDPDRGSTMAAR